MFEIVCDFYGLHSFLNLIKLISVLCGAVLVLCCVPSLLQMSRRSSKGKDIVTDDPSTPVAKGLDSHLNHLKTPIWRGSEPCLPHTSTQTFLTRHLL